MNNKKLSPPAPTAPNTPLDGPTLREFWEAIKKMVPRGVTAAQALAAVSPEKAEMPAGKTPLQALVSPVSIVSSGGVISSGAMPSSQFVVTSGMALTSGSLYSSGSICSSGGITSSGFITSSGGICSSGAAISSGAVLSSGGAAAAQEGGYGLGLIEAADPVDPALRERIQEILRLLCDADGAKKE